MAVYNAERSLRKCLDSIILQSFKSFELILVDDGSTDSSGDICDSYALRDGRVSVVHKNNGGVSSARQTGLERAIGDYIIYVDSDDWVEPDFLEKLYNAAVASGVGMVVCDYIEEYGSSCKTIDCSLSSWDPDSVIKSIFEGYPPFCLNKLVKRTLFIDNSITFPLDISIGEDMYVVVSLLKAGISSTHIPNALYHYSAVSNSNSLSRSFTLENFNDTERMLKKFSCLMTGNRHWHLCEKYIVRRLVSRSFYNGLFSSGEFRRRMFRYRRQIICNANIGIGKRVIFYFSCVGFYSVMFSLVNAVKPWKRITREY